MLNSVALRGGVGSVLWGYHAAADVVSWRITHHRPDPKHAGHWTLVATLRRADKFQLRQRPLMFTAPRQGGFWCWPLLTDTIQIGDTKMTARLGPPEQ